MSAVRDVVNQLAEHADLRLLAGLYSAVSVPTERVRERLRRTGRPFVDGDGPPPPMIDVDDTATWVIEQATYSAASLSGFAALGGLASIPPETIASSVAVLRLAQRLAVVYGFDPDTDRGQVAVWRALAAGLEVELPGEGPLEVRLRDLPQMMLPSVTLESAGAQFARAVIVRTAFSILRRVTRLVPVVSTGMSAYSARQRMAETGARMQSALQRLSETAGSTLAIEDAVEIR